MSGRKLKVYYPWKETPVGSCFFVPTLDFVQTKNDGLRAAVWLRMRGEVRYGIWKGKTGVMFKRLR